MNLQLPTGSQTTLPEPSFRIAWEDQGEKRTKSGPRNLHTATMPEGWWDYWKLHKDAMKAVGLSCGKDRDDNWQVSLWTKLAAGAATPPANFSTALLDMSRASAPSKGFSVTIPPEITPYPYQVAGVEYALRRPRCIIGDDMGLGKTLQAIMVCNQTQAKSVLVVCPASLRLNWLSEWERFSLTTSVLQPIMSKKEIPLIAQSDVVFISYDIMASAPAQKLLRDRNWDVLIADEAHYLQNHKTKRASGLLGLPKGVRGKAARTPIAADRYLFLTGTPISNRPENFWNLLRFCAPEHFGGWTIFAMQYCDAKRVPFGSGWDTTGKSNLGELQQIIRGSCMVRRLKKDVLKQLPPKTRKIVALPTPAEVIRELDALTLQFRNSEATAADLRKRIKGAKEAGDASEMEEVVQSLRAAENAIFTETSAVRKLIGLRKVELAIDHIKNALDESGGKVIVGAWHSEVVDQLRKGLESYGCAVVTGSVPPAKRQVAVDRFQGDSSCRVFIGNIVAAGTGLTLTAAPHVVIVEPDWVPANNWQFEDRAHRIGQSQPVLIEYLAMEGTIDIQILRANAKKMDTIEQAVDRTDSRTETLDPRVINARDSEPKRPSVLSKEGDESDRRKKRIATMKVGTSLTPRELLAAHSCVREVAKMDFDQAQAQNGVGFSRMDSEYGGKIARKSLQNLTDYEKGRVAHLGWKYRKQCPERIAEQLINPKSK